MHECHLLDVRYTVKQHRSRLNCSCRLIFWVKYLPILRKFSKVNPDISEEPSSSPRTVHGVNHFELGWSRWRPRLFAHHMLWSPATDTVLFFSQCHRRRFFWQSLACSTYDTSTCYSLCGICRSWPILFCPAGEWAGSLVAGMFFFSTVCVFGWRKSG